MEKKGAPHYDATALKKQRLEGRPGQRLEEKGEGRRGCDGGRPKAPEMKIRKPIMGSALDARHCHYARLT